MPRRDMANQGRAQGGAAADAGEDGKEEEPEHRTPARRVQLVAGDDSLLDLSVQQVAQRFPQVARKHLTAAPARPPHAGAVGCVRARARLPARSSARPPPCRRSGCTRAWWRRS